MEAATNELIELAPFSLMLVVITWSNRKLTYVPNNTCTVTSVPELYGLSVSPSEIFGLVRSWTSCFPIC